MLGKASCLFVVFETFMFSRWKNQQKGIFDVDWESGDFIDCRKVLVSMALESSSDTFSRHV
jgi:hypothetical protein